MSKFHSLNLWSPDELSKFDLDVENDKISFSSEGSLAIEIDTVVSLKSSHGDVPDLAQKLKEVSDAIASGAVGSAAAAALVQTNLDNAVTSLTSSIGTLTSDLTTQIGIQTAAQVADSVARGVISSDLAAEIVRATSAEQLLTTNLSEEKNNRISGDAAVLSAMTSGDVALGVRIDVEKARVDSILSGSSIDLNQLTELIAAYTSADSSLLTQVQTLQASVTTLQNDIDSLTSSLN